MENIHEPTQSTSQTDEPETIVGHTRIPPTQPLTKKPRVFQSQPLVEDQWVQEGDGQEQASLPLPTPSIAEQPQQRVEVLPRRGGRYAFITGIVMGVLGTALTLVIILLNANLFQTARLQVIHDALTVNVALALLGIFAGIGVLLVLISLIGGLIIGRIAVRRRLGFWAGILGGAIVFIVVWLVSLIPGYPAHLGGTPALSGGSLILSLLWLILTCLAGGLISLFGTWVTSGRHPHYRR